MLLRVLGNWLSTRDDILMAFITLRDGGLAFVVIRSESRYDAAFEDDLSDLDIEVSEDPQLELVPINSLALPPANECAIDTFLDSRFALRFANAERD